MKTLTAFLALFLFTLTTAHAADGVSVGDITVSKAWARATIGANRPGGAFLTIFNKGSASDRLVTVETPAAARAMLHKSVMEDGVMKMKHVMAMDIPAGGMTMLKPGGFHVMLLDLTAPLNEGDMFHLNLVFEKAGKASIMVHVGKVGGMMSMDHGDMNSMDHQKHMQDEEHKKMHDEHMKDEEHKKMHDEHMKKAATPVD